jgi:hypothetical protein
VTLLEATIAFVLLSVVGIVCLEQSSAASRLESSSVEWRRAVARGDAALQNAVANVPLPDETRGAADSVRVSRRAWRGRVDLVEVSVLLPTGSVYSTQRLVERASGGAR